MNFSKDLFKCTIMMFKITNFCVHISFWSATETTRLEFQVGDKNLFTRTGRCHASEGI